MDHQNIAMMQSLMCSVDYVIRFILLNDTVLFVASDVTQTTAVITQLPVCIAAARTAEG
jgi:hypothetical protein